jgi:hypothetical protein
MTGEQVTGGSSHAGDSDAVLGIYCSGGSAKSMDRTKVKLPFNNIRPNRPTTTSKRSESCRQHAHQLFFIAFDAHSF